MKARLSCPNGHDRGRCVCASSSSHRQGPKGYGVVHHPDTFFSKEYHATQVALFKSKKQAVMNAVRIFKPVFPTQFGGKKLSNK
jgi:hypothetical protein